MRCKLEPTFYALVRSHFTRKQWSKISKRDKLAIKAMSDSQRHFKEAASDDHRST